MSSSQEISKGSAKGAKIRLQLRISSYACEDPLEFADSVLTRAADQEEGDLEGKQVETGELIRCIPPDREFLAAIEPHQIGHVDCMKLQGLLLLFGRKRKDMFVKAGQSSIQRINFHVSPLRGASFSRFCTVDIQRHLSLPHALFEWARASNRIYYRLKRRTGEQYYIEYFISDDYLALFQSNKTD